MKSSATSKKRVSDHLAELRNRLLVCLLFFVFFSALSYYFHDTLIELLLLPFNKPIYFTSPTGGFSLLINISLLFGFLLSLPVMLYHIISFASPVFPKHSRKLLFIAISASLLLLIMGVLFAYFVCLPAAFHFLGGFESNNVQSLVTSSEYFTFVTRYILGFGLIFQLPLALLLINYVYPLNVKRLVAYSGYVVLASFILSAILTPTPDPINQAIMAVPIILLYFLSVIIILVAHRKK